MPSHSCPPIFDPLVQEWFSAQFGSPTPPQLQGWPAIRGGGDVLISAPTGSGKTLAAFLICLDALVREAREGSLAEETRVVYVSPLKALSNDVHKHLDLPLAQIRALAERRGVTLAPIRTAVRTGDTPASERQRMGKHPPHILVTTPESLFILMTAERSRAMLRATRTVIVDEIHAMADDKRGSHLALTLARLDALTGAALTPARAVAEWQRYFAELTATGRASVMARHGKPFWIATERLAMADDFASTLRGWMESLGPVTIGVLSERLALSREDVDAALHALEGQGLVLRGRFSVPEGEGEMQLCNRRILARIHHATLGRLRREIEPVTALDLYRFLCRWQHMAPGSRLHGADGVLQVIRQLQGYEIPAASWEPEILARRVANYDPADLDELCLSGEVMWGRPSPHPAMEDADGRRVRPTRMTPISFFPRESLGWLAPAKRESPGVAEGVAEGAAEAGALSHAAQGVLAVLRERGASFFADLARGSGRLASEVEDALWELVAAGLVTADGLENLRALIDPKRRRGEGRGRTTRPRHAGGRWALLEPEPALAARIEEFADQLIRRWGVLMRDLLAREATAPFWRDLLPVLRRKEAQGELRGGRFVAGFSGEQFAAPEALDVLRRMRRSDFHPEDDLQIANADPLNLAGIILPGARVSRLAS